MTRLTWTNATTGETYDVPSDNLLAEAEAICRENDWLMKPVRHPDAKPDHHTRKRIEFRTADGELTGTIDLTTDN